MLALNPDLDRARLARCYSEHGHVAIDGLLAEGGAALLLAHLKARTDWRRLVLSGERVAEFDRPGWQAVPADGKAALDAAVYASARQGFQFRFESIRVSDAAAARRVADDPLNAFAEWMSGGEILDFLREVTGETDVRFCDAQGTAYAPGDFLTAHDDAVAGKARRAAYVFGLNPVWRPEWGGVLLFHDADQRVRGIAPGFNRLDLFRVPQQHSVSEVTRAAPNRRYSVTGWLRAMEQPATE